MQTKKECLFLMQTRNKNWIIYEIITECTYKNRIIYKKISLSDRDDFLIDRQKLFFETIRLILISLIISDNSD